MKSSRSVCARSAICLSCLATAAHSLCSRSAQRAFREGLASTLSLIVVHDNDLVIRRQGELHRGLDGLVF